MNTTSIVFFIINLSHLQFSKNKEKSTRAKFIASLVLEPSGTQSLIMRKDRVDENKKAAAFFFDTIDRSIGMVILFVENEIFEKKKKRKRQPLNSEKKICSVFCRFSTALKRNTIHKTVEREKETNYLQIY